MWPESFRSDVFQSAALLSLHSNNRCYKAVSGGQSYFIKELTANYTALALRERQQRIEYAESVNLMFSQNGLRTVTAVFFDGKCTHVDRGHIFVAYPWLETTPIEQVDREVCYRAGKFTAEMHRISGLLTAATPAPYKQTHDFSWAEQPDAPLSEKEIQSIRTHLAYGEQCRDYLGTLKPVISHGDIHPGNFTFKDRYLTILDWELVSPVFPLSDLFDAALNFCGFCSQNTDLDLFESVLRGYHDNNETRFGRESILCSVGEMYYCILSRVCADLCKYAETQNKVFLDSAAHFLSQYHDLLKYQNRFEHIILNTIE